VGGKGRPIRASPQSLILWTSVQAKEVNSLAFLQSIISSSTMIRNAIWYRCLLSSSSVSDESMFLLKVGRCLVVSRGFHRFIPLVPRMVSLQPILYFPWRQKPLNVVVASQLTTDVQDVNDFGLRFITSVTPTRTLITRSEI
jgi:hypothetical protein